MLSVIIPVYFEKENIIKTLDEIKKKVKVTYTILIVYDLDEDPTKKVVQDYVKRNNAKNIQLVKNNQGSKRGVANAVKTGIYKTKTDRLIVVMGDLSDDIVKINQMSELIDKGYDIISGSRYMKGGQQIGGPRLKSALSRIAGLSLYYLFKIPTHDSTNSFKMYRKSIFNNMKIESHDGFDYNLEIIVKAYKRKFKITEVSAIWRDRTGGKSKFKLFRWLPKYLRWYLYLMLK